MKIMNLRFSVPDDFELGECEKCPLATYFSSDGQRDCIMGYRSCNCPLHESVVIEEEYID